MHSLCVLAAASALKIKILKLLYSVQMSYRNNFTNIPCPNGTTEPVFIFMSAIPPARVVGEAALGLETLHDLQISLL